jgi:hypothetical protein
MLCTSFFFSNVIFLILKLKIISHVFFLKQRKEKKAKLQYYTKQKNKHELMYTCREEKKKTNGMYNR